MLLKRKKLYSIWNEDGLFETQYEELHITFKSKNQSDWIMLTIEDKVEIFEYARVLWKI